MATASSPQWLRPVSLWRRPLLVGVCFGLGYGLTQRLLDLRLPGLVQWGQSFDVREFPGTSLDSLRLRFGSNDQDLRGRLDRVEPQAETLDKPLADPTALAQPADQTAEPAAPESTAAPAAPSLPAPPTVSPPPASSQP